MNSRTRVPTPLQTSVAATPWHCSQSCAIPPGLPSGDASVADNGPYDNTPVDTGVVQRGVGPDPPPGGYLPGDIIFFGYDDGPTGHDALWLGNGQIVQCSASGNGSNIRPLAGYVTPTGWVRWTAVTG